MDARFKTAFVCALAILTLGEYTPVCAQSCSTVLERRTTDAPATQLKRRISQDLGFHRLLPFSKGTIIDLGRDEVTDLAYPDCQFQVAPPRLEFPSYSISPPPAPGPDISIESIDIEEPACPSGFPPLPLELDLPIVNRPFRQAKNPSKSNLGKKKVILIDLDCGAVHGEIMSEP